MSEIRKAISRETLVAMGMSDTDAGGIVGRLNAGDLESIAQDDVKIAFGAGPGPTAEMLLFSFLVFAALIGVLLLLGLTFAEIGIGFGALIGFCILINLISDTV